MNRRRFVEIVTTASLLSLTGRSSGLRANEVERTPRGYKKAVKLGMVQIEGTLLEKFQLLKELGFDGVELNAPGGPSADEVRQAQRATGLEVPGVVDSVHWKETLSDADPAVRETGRLALEQALRDCQAYGGTSVLLVPGIVTAGVSYEQCWDRSLAEVRKAIPLAEKLGVDIVIENVWNDFLTVPKEFARYIDACQSARVGAQFDVGNTVRYSPPHEWIPVLGKRIKKLDIKDYKRGGQNLYDGFSAKLLEGDVDWPRVMSELAKVGYIGWGTAEIQGGGREWLADVAQRMNRIFAG